jgi:hypothetical protein
MGAGVHVNDLTASLILDCGRRYCRDTECLGRWEGQQPLLLGDWRSAYGFFMGRAAYQGRRDDLSQRVEEGALGTLAEFWADGSLDLERNRGAIEQRLGERIGLGKVGKGRDIVMIMDSLDFIYRLPGRNIVAYSIDQVRTGQTVAHYRELQRSENARGITQVGPKIAAFYLRDLVSLFDLEGAIDPASAACLQPVDTWVRQVAEKIGIVGSRAGDDEVRGAIVALCSESGYSAVLFNQGVWYLATHALDLLLDGSVRIS